MIPPLPLVERDERQAPLKTPAWEAKAIMNITRNKAKKRENTHTHTHTHIQTDKESIVNG